MGGRGESVGNNSLSYIKCIILKKEYEEETSTFDERDEWDFQMRFRE